ncbi:MAG: M3 family peptidase, partial [Bdellovibrionales bacterium]|nr:M3 family peptidase [Bdellovibrionales bacterium]
MSQNKNSHDNLSSNPLLHDSNLPHLAVPFPDIKLEHFLPALKESIRQAKAGIEKISKNPEPPTFANTIEAMEISGERVDLISHVYYNLLSAETSDELQALASEIGPLLSNLSSDILHDGALFLRVKSVYENADRGKMSAEQITLLEDTYVDFTRNGALLDEAGKEQ